jgi:hypothetical protein
MKKLLGLALAVALVSSAITAKAEILKNVRTHGEIEVLGVMTKNITDADSTAGDDYRDTQTRLTFGLTFDLLDDVHANLTFVKNDQYYGRTTGQNLNQVQNNVLVEESNIVIDRLFDRFQAKIGRQFYGNPGDIVIYYGPRYFETLPVAGLDAIRVDTIDLENLHLMGLWGRNPDGTIVTNEIGAGAGAATDVDISILGLTADYMVNENWTAGLFAWNRRIGNNSQIIDADNLWILGFKSTGEYMGFGHEVEAAFNLGSQNSVNSGAGGEKSPKYAGYAVIAKLNYKKDLNGNILNPRGMFAYGSGDNQNASTTGANRDMDKTFYGINPDFMAGDIFSGSLVTSGTDGFLIAPGAGTDAYSTYYLNGALATGPNTLSNLTVYNLGVDFTPAMFPKWTSSLDVFKHRLSSVATGFNKDLGTELDWKNAYKYNDNVMFCLTLSRYWVGSAIRQANNGVNDPMSKASTYISVKF